MPPTRGSAAAGGHAGVFIDHGATPPSTLAALTPRDRRASSRACVAAGILGFGRYHGGDIESCMQFLDAGVDLVRGGASYSSAAEEIVERWKETGDTLPGFGHRFHTRDPRAARLFQMALELEVEGTHIQMIRAVEMLQHTRHQADEPPLNHQTSTARLRRCAADWGCPDVANACSSSRGCPGIAAQAKEETGPQKPMRRSTEGSPLRRPAERRVPATEIGPLANAMRKSRRRP